MYVNEHLFQSFWKTKIPVAESDFAKPSFTCSKQIKETSEQWVISVQS